MTTVTFDTLQFVKELETKGFTPQQAEGINSALKNVITTSEVATKSDIEKMSLQLKTEFNVLKWICGANTAGLLFLISRTIG